MKYIYLFLWLSFKNVIGAGKNTYHGYNRAHLSSHVVGGVEVPISMYPHVAVLATDKRYLCGGSIVSDRLIVTAGHCIVKHKKSVYKPDSVEVFLGSAQLKKGERHAVCKVVPHKLYIKPDNETPQYFYDIGVLMMKERIKFGQSIQKIDIAPNDSWRNEKNHFTVAGFGKANIYGSGTQKLLATRMHFVNSRTCNESQSLVPMIVPDHMFCMIGVRWTSDCFGDSGSGVVWRRYLVGVVSTGRDLFCGGDLVPSMYTDVTYFRKWIASKIKEADSLPEHACQSSKKQRNLYKSKKTRWTDLHQS